MTLSAKGLGVLSIVVVLVLSPGCQSPAERNQASLQAMAPRIAYPTMGSIERFDASLEEILPAYTVIEKLAQGFEWAEGPVWVPEMNSVLFSDVPKNVVHRWDEVTGVTPFLKPSGYTGSDARGGEPGSNGLTLDPEGRLVLCQHGDRRLARVKLHEEKDPLSGKLKRSLKFNTLAAHYKFLRFNSPNDLTFHSSGAVYFTDPPYGLEKGNADPKKELMFNGVFRMSPKGEVTLLTTELTFPNGIAFSPDETRLYVAVSDPENPVIMVYDVKGDGTIANGRVFFDAKPLAAQGRKGLPDGLKTDVRGNLFATGPGGVLVISPSGKLLGILNTGEATANCGWGNDGSVLYITADMYLCRVKTWTRGQLPAWNYPTLDR